MTLVRYALIVVAAAAASQALAAPWLAESAWRASAVGALLASLNAVAAYGLALWAEGRSTTAFFGAVLGGMLARMACLLLAFVVAVKWLSLETAPLTVSLLGHFAAFLVLELGLLHRRRAVQPAEAR